MLVLSTKLEEGVQIGEDIRITVIDVRPRNVRLGIEAPKSIAIRRDSMNGQSAHATRTKESLSDSAAVEVESESTSDSSMSILLVSRDQPLVVRLKRALDEDTQVNTAIVGSITDAKRGIAAQQAVDPSHRPDLVLLDLDLSPQTAILLMRWLRQVESRRVIPIVAMRSEATPHATASVLSAGANVVVKKDQSWQSFSRAVRSAVDLWRYSDTRAVSNQSASARILQEHVA